MRDRVRALRARWLTPAVLATVLVCSSAPSVAANHLTVPEAERYLFSLLNGQRKAAGLRPLRIDRRLWDLAGDRSADMVSRDYFAHETPDGRDLGDMLKARGIVAYKWGEIIAWNTYGIDDSAKTAARMWRASRVHYAQITKPDYNYAGVGLAIDGSSGKKVWTVVFIKGPDRTGAWARMSGLSVSSTGALTVSWRGADILLASLTSGLRDFTVQRRVDGGAWSTAWSRTTSRSRTVTAARGHLYEYRVRARDNVGNVGRWSPVMGVHR